MGENVVTRPPADVVAYVDQVIGRLDGGMGYLRRAHVRHIAYHMVRRFQEVEGQPPNLEAAAFLGAMAIVATYVSEIGQAIRWDPGLAVRIAEMLLYMTGCTEEAAAVRSAAERTGTWQALVERSMKRQYRKD